MPDRPCFRHSHLLACPIANRARVLCRRVGLGRHLFGNTGNLGGHMSAYRRLFGAFIILLATSTLAFAQGTGDIVGRVTDTSGGVLPAVTVTSENVATKISRTTITSETGD